MSERYNASLLAKHIENAIDNARKLGIKVAISGNKIIVENTAHLNAPHVLMLVLTILILRHISNCQWKKRILYNDRPRKI